MRQLKYSQLSDAIDVSKIATRLQLPHFVKIPKLEDVILVLLPASALFLWAFSLRYVNIRNMNDLGLVSVLPPSIIIALLVLTVSFCLTLQQPQRRVPILLLHVVLLIFMLYSITTLIEEAPRFAVVYRHAGFTEYIMRTGSVAPNLDAYFNWPGFFVLTAFVTRAVGYHDALNYAAWAPVFLNLIYIGPLYMIFTSATTDKRLVWLGLWFFYLTNWIGQDYFSPQGFNFFLYLVIIAILLKWFKAAPAVQTSTQRQRWQRLGRFSHFVRELHGWLTAPDMLRTPSRPQQRMALLVGLLLIFALSVFSHPLTPFFVLASVTALVIFRRCTPLWLPILLGIMTAAWIIFMTRPFLAGHSDFITGDLGHIGNTITTNTIDRVEYGSLGHTFIAEIRVIMTVAIWGLALVGGVRRLRKGHRDITYILLAIAPFPLLLAQSYGGEMILRIYLFSLPLMVFFAAALFYTASTSGTSRWTTTAVVCANIILLAGFLFTRYGNERMDYMTYAEVDGIRYLYSVAQPGSLLIKAWNDSPWQFQDFEKYNYDSMAENPYNDAVRTDDVGSIIRSIESAKFPHTYLIFTRSEKATVDLTSGFPPGALDRLEKSLLLSGKFKVIYSNSDAQIFEYLH